MVSLVLNILLIFIVGLIPPLLSLIIMRRADARNAARLTLVMESIAQHPLSTLDFDPDLHYVDGLGYVIGDMTCQFNARSRHLRCGVNPMGPCKGCFHYVSTLPEND